MGTEQSPYSQSLRNVTTPVNIAKTYRYVKLGIHDTTKNSTSDKVKI